MISLRHGAVLAMMMLGTSALAQDVPYPPLLSDQPPGYEFADGQPVDILGIALGMPRREAATRLQEIVPGKQVNPRENIVEISDSGGNSASARYHFGDVISGQVEGRDVRLELTYTTAVGGERVSIIDREEKFTGDQPGAAAFQEALAAKYGEPTHVNEYRPRQGGGFTTLQWHWIEGKLLPPSDRRPQGNCENSLASAYVFSSRRLDSREGCTAFLEVQIWPGARQDLMSRISMEMIGHLRIYENGVATDAWFAEQVAKARDALSPGAGPAL